MSNTQPTPDTTWCPFHGATHRTVASMQHDDDKRCIYEVVAR